MMRPAVVRSPREPGPVDAELALDVRPENATIATLVDEWAVERENARAAAAAADATAARRGVSGATVALLLLVAANLFLWFASPRATPIRRFETASIAATRAEVLLVANQVEAFRARYGRLPQSAAELPVMPPGVRYVTAGQDRYLIADEDAAEPIVYRSTEPLEDFARRIRR